MIRSTPKNGEPGTTHTMKDVAVTDSVASVVTTRKVTTRRSFQMTLPKKTTPSHSGALGVISRASMMWRRRFLSVSQVRLCQLGFRSLDVAQLCDAFEQRGCVMQNVPRFLRGF